MDLNIQLIHNEILDGSKPEFEAKIQLKKITVQMSKNQYEMILDIGKTYIHSDLDKYLLSRIFKRMRYWKYRPLYSILDKESTGEIKNKEKIKNENAVLWWKYAIKTVRLNCKQNKKG